MKTLLKNIEHNSPLPVTLCSVWVATQLEKREIWGTLMFSQILKDEISHICKTLGKRVNGERAYVIHRNGI